VTWERHLFDAGRRYRAKKSFSSGASSFVAGEVLTFERDGYSYYDSSFAYEFRGADGTLKTWWLHDYKPAGSWVDFFEPVTQ
jgi:hypothetical protein